MHASLRSLLLKSLPVSQKNAQGGSVKLKQSDRSVCFYSIAPTSPLGHLMVEAQRTLQPGLGEAARWNKQFVGTNSLTRCKDRLQGPSTMLPAFSLEGQCL
jgi:hypothetical protein